MTAKDRYEGKVSELSDPAEDHFAINKSDTNDFAVAARAIYVGGDGDVAIVSIGGTVVTYVGVLAGTILPIRCRRVNESNTSATNMVGWI